MPLIAKDHDAKKRLGYRCKDSIVYVDGREKLEGNDYKRRVAELQRRAEGRCEYILGQKPMNIRCGAAGDDPHHIIKRSKSRDDRLSNLQFLCRYHHNLVDERKVSWTVKRNTGQ